MEIVDGFTVKIKKKTRNWIVSCPELKIFGYSPVSKSEAIKDFFRALETFIHVHEKRGTLNKVFPN